MDKLVQEDRKEKGRAEEPSERENCKPYWKLASERQSQPEGMESVHLPEKRWTLQLIN
jgi:hypothetical protein